MKGVVGIESRNREDTYHIRGPSFYAIFLDIQFDRGRVNGAKHFFQ